MAKFTDALKFWSKPLTRGVRAITGNLDEQEEGQLRQEQERLFQSILNTTQPFRMGANTFAQNYGPAFRALTGGDPLTPGPVEQFTREALTPEEQDYLERKPYMTALKSSVGMGSSLMPFASRAVPAATLGARTAQIAGRGLLEGLAGGLGYSREGKELQDTAVGGAIGMGGELLGNYAFDPSYRSMVNQGYGDISQGKYQAAVGNIGDSIEDLRMKAFEAAGLDPNDISQMGQGLGVQHSNKYISDIELLQRGQKSPVVGEYLKELRDQGLVDPGQVDVLLRLDYGIQPEVKGASDSITGEELAQWARENSSQVSDDIFTEKGLPQGTGQVGSPFRGPRPRFAGFVDYNEEEPTETLIRMLQDRKRGAGEGSSSNDLRRQINELTKRILDKNGNLK